VGELLIEGPVVGDGYLNNPEKTAEVFIEDPSFTC
jgi:long-subunit acyl-CoA synthetase (AMP-forming)